MADAHFNNNVGQILQYHDITTFQALAFSKTNNQTAQTSKASKQIHKLANATAEFLIIN